MVILTFEIHHLDFKPCEFGSAILGKSDHIFLLSFAFLFINFSFISRELMALCLKKLKNLNKVKLIDANFLWTEPHSKRIKVKLSIQVMYSHVVHI